MYFPSFIDLPFCYPPIPIPYELNIHAKIMYENANTKNQRLAYAPSVPIVFRFSFEQIGIDKINATINAGPFIKIPPVIYNVFYCQSNPQKGLEH